MKLLSNFNTNLDEQIYDKKTNQYGKENVMLIKKDKFFYQLHVLLPSILFFIVSISLLSFGAFLDLGPGIDKVKWFVIAMVLIVYLFGVAFRVIQNYIDYQMDFAVVTPDGVTYMNQTGFFSRNSETIDADKIKSMSVKKSGIIKSFFDFGTVVFLSEGDQHYGDIELKFINSPSKTKSQIIDLIHFGWQDDASKNNGKENNKK